MCTVLLYFSRPNVAYIHIHVILYVINLYNNDDRLLAFTFSSNTNTSHRGVRQHSSRHSRRSRCSTESMNFAPNFLESSVRMILSSCTSNLFAQIPESAVVATRTTAYTIRKHWDGVTRPTAAIWSVLVSSHAKMHCPAVGQLFVARCCWAYS